MFLFTYNNIGDGFIFICVIYFFLVAPENVKIRVEPEELVPGIEATMTCDSSSSNPPATITWWKDGIPVEGINNTSKSGLWGGTVSSLDLKINVTQDMNDIVYTCQSNNEALSRSVHEAIKLQVLCKYWLMDYFYFTDIFKHKFKEKMSYGKKLIAHAQITSTTIPLRFLTIS